MYASAFSRHVTAAALVAAIAVCAGSGPAQALTVSQEPLFRNANNSPMAMIVMGNDHTLFYQAYNDASDLTGNGVLNVGYDPRNVDYYGYFDSFLCYNFSDVTQRFYPVGTTTRANLKRCPGRWSGDFLNYLTTSRMDALRRVLYGGTRVIDTPTLTVLERAHIPQDAHSWGKEYRSIEFDGYDIRDYTPLPLPQSRPGVQLRHLFANTTLLERTPNPPEFWGRDPRLRILTDSRFRVWQWVAKERPVAGFNCDRGGNSVVACDYASFLNQFNRAALNEEDMQELREEWTTELFMCGSGPIPLTGDLVNSISWNGSINKRGLQNPFRNTGRPECDATSGQRILTRIRGQIFAPESGTYRFATNGREALEFWLQGDRVSWWYGAHDFANATGTPANQVLQIETNITNGQNAQIGAVELQAGNWYDFEFWQESHTNNNNGFRLLWLVPGQAWAVVPPNRLRSEDTGIDAPPTITTWPKRQDLPASDFRDFIVRVEVCNPDFPEAHCRRYPNGALKPTGLLHDYGETDQMFFGLMTGSSTHPFNMRGGVLRKNIESFQNEIDPETGQFLPVAGIVQTIDRFRAVDFRVDQNFQYSGGWLTTASMAASNSQFPDWGNPIAEMMYEAVRYFAGNGRTPTAQFFSRNTLVNVAGELFERVRLRDISTETFNFVPAPNWKDPYTREDAARPWCTPAAKLLISDVNPSFDSQFVPGSSFFTFAGDIDGLNVSTEVDAIWAAEYGGAQDVFIGQVGDLNDSAPSVKRASGFSNIRGLSPSEPTRQGSFYSAGVARFAYRTDLRPDLRGRQNIQTFSVALASPLPEIDLPTPAGVVRVVPFAKSVGGSGISNVKGQFQPTNTIVDFFIEQFANTDPEGSDADPTVNEGRPYVLFRINYEDVEQGADHDMDAIVRYELRVNANGTLTVNLETEYQAGGIQHAMGYVISGTTTDGVYLEVADELPPNNPAYFLNTPAGRPPGWCDQDPYPDECRLPRVASRTFTPDPTAERATLLNSPLWYAAKYGADGNQDLAPGETPDNYFLVTNASNLAAQLRRALERILSLASVTGVSVSSTRLSTSDLAYVAEFDSDGWTGDLVAVEPTGSGETEVWRASQRLPGPASRNIMTWDPVTGSGLPFSYDAMSVNVRTSIGVLDLEVEEGLFERIQTSEIIDYIRGDQSLEIRNGGLLRDRRRLIADIVNSVPVFSGQGNEGWVRLGGSIGGRYADHIEFRRESRNPIVLVGSNGGMLHGFSAGRGATGGRELFAFVPAAVHSNLKMLADPAYGHRFFVDGQVRVADAFINGRWRTVAVGATGAGGRSVFALDVTDPTSFDSSNVLWEFSDPDMGYTIGQPLITRLDNNTEEGLWVAVFGNGFGSQDHRAALYIVNLATGQLINGGKIFVGGGDEQDPNGLASPGLWLDPATRVMASRIYAGDLHGNMWRFDLVQPNDRTVPGAQPILAFPNGEPLFTDPDNRRITAAPAIAAHPSGGLMIFFGTGSYFAVGDNILPANDPAIDRFHAIRDYHVSTTGNQAFPVPVPDPTRIARLTLQRSLISEGRREFVVSGGGNGDDGWSLELALDGVRLGERVLTRPSVVAGQVFFATYQPSEDPCEGGGRTFFYAAQALQSVSDGSGAVGSGQELSIGAPLVTPIVITEPEPIAEPSDPDAPPGSIPGYDRPPQDSWCRRISVLLPDGEGNLVPQTISWVCDGRQSWRQQL